MNGRSSVLTYLRRAFGALYLRGPLSTDDTAKVLHHLLLALFTWNGLWTIILFPYSTGHPPQLTAIATMELALVAALVTLRLGSLQVASWIYMAGIWLFATAVIVQNGGIRSVVLALYVTLPVSAAWLLGYRASLWTTGVCLGSALVFALLESAGVRLPHTIPGTPIGIWVQLAAAVLMGVMPLAQVLWTRTEALTKVLEQVESLQRRDDKLRESEERFRTLADTAPVMIAVTGPDKFASFFNKAWLEFRGHTMEEELGYGWTEGLHPDDRAIIENQRSSIETDRSRKFECRFRRADGEYRWLLCTTVARFDHRGALSGYIGSSIDITDVKRAQEEAFASQKLESLGVLARGIAHDFNNMLGSILANSELVLSELPVSSPAESGVQSIKNVADRAAGIVRQMMAYAGQENAALEPLDLTELVKEMLQLLKVSISKRATLRLDLPENLPAVLANSAQIRQVVMNLVMNASEALGEKDGVISITLALVGAGRGRSAETATNFLQNDHLRLVVSDSGCGMTGEIQARIFDPYFTTKLSGRGLGLAAVQGIIRDHGGTIHVISTPGEGSRFEVRLPCTGRPARRAQDSRVQPSAGKGTVLVVEDEETLRLAVSRFLRKQGFSVLEAGDGPASVDRFRSNGEEIDVVLLDLTLPGMHGRDVLEELRRIRPYVKVIVTTAYSQESALKGITGQQPWAFIRKPYQLNELMTLLQDACRKESE